MYIILLIGIGGAIGSIFRYLCSTWIHSFLGRDFPYGTLFVNTLGSFLMGLLFVLLLERFNYAGNYLRSFLLIGVLGGFTTFSSFSIETFNLIESGSSLRGLMNIFASIFLTLIAVWLGIILGRKI